MFSISCRQFWLCSLLQPLSVTCITHPFISRCLCSLFPTASNLSSHSDPPLLGHPPFSLSLPAPKLVTNDFPPLPLPRHCCLLAPFGSNSLSYCYSVPLSGWGCTCTWLNFEVACNCGGMQMWMNCNICQRSYIGEKVSFVTLIDATHHAIASWLYC